MTAPEPASAAGAHADRVDLHTHSDVSDGLLAPEELVRRAAREGIGWLALTDHDTTDGVARAQAAAPAGLRVVPAIELTARVRPGPHGTVHLLGYGVDPASPRLAAAARHNRLAKRAQVTAILARLRAEERIDVPLAEVLGGRGEDAYVGRNQVASALVRRNHAQDVRRAFRRFLDAKRVPEVDAVPAEEAVAALREAGGLVALAHPTDRDLDEHLGPLARLGVEGLEVWRPRAVGHHLERVQRAAARRGLIATAGSDWHGRHPDPPYGTWKAPRAHELAPALARLTARPA